MAKKHTPKKPTKKTENVLADRLETLLHTIRTIAQHEDELCTLLHEARAASRIKPALARELRAVLDIMPAEEYAWEIHALQMELDNNRLEAAA